MVTLFRAGFGSLLSDKEMQLKAWAILVKKFFRAYLELA
jgi:hypothetical protein